MEFQCVYVLLSRLCKDFEPRRAQFLAWGSVPILEVLSERRAKETHLCGADLLEVPSVFAPRIPTTFLLHRCLISLVLCHYYPLLLVVSLSLVLVITVTTTTRMDTMSVIATKRSVTGIIGSTHLLVGHILLL
jgi:hypothetical protein